MQELEKGVDALLEQYKGMEELQEEKVQSAPLAAVPARSTKRNRHTLRGMLTPSSFNPCCLFPMLCRRLIWSACLCTISVSLMSAQRQPAKLWTVLRQLV